MEPNPPQNPPNPDQNILLDPKSFKLAIAVALLRFQKQQQQKQPPPQPPSSASTSDAAQRWKQKAKDRKREILRLRNEIQHLEDGAEREELCSRVVSCACHFFDGCGELGPKRIRLGEGGGDGGEGWIDEVLRRRFLRHVRWNERRKKSEGSSRHRHLLESNIEDELEQLSTSGDFLVELSDTISVDKNSPSFTALSHQAVDFILASVKNLLLLKKDKELIEDIISGLIMRLTKRMCSPSDPDGLNINGLEAQSFVQHVVRSLGNESYIGQRIVLSITQRICILAEDILLVDPFDDAFPDMHDWLFTMIQLIELMVSDNTYAWTSSENFDGRLFEEWLRSVVQAHKALKLLECRNGLYILYLERVTAELVKQLGPLSCQGKLSLEILSSILC